MATIYETHDKAFANVSAYVVAKAGERVATIAFKFPKDGAGRLQVFVHWFGNEMIRGTASGYGYDKRSAAVANAIEKSPFRKFGAKPGSADESFHSALLRDGGEYWDARLRNAGFEVWQAV